MVAALWNLIIWLLVVGILYALVEFVLTNVPLPAPVANIVRVVIVVILALVVVSMLLSLTGIDTGLQLPKITG